MQTKSGVFLRQERAKHISAEMRKRISTLYSMYALKSCNMFKFLQLHLHHSLYLWVHKSCAEIDTRMKH